MSSTKRSSLTSAGMHTAVGCGVDADPASKGVLWLLINLLFLDQISLPLSGLIQSITGLSAMMVIPRGSDASENQRLLPSKPPLPRWSIPLLHIIIF